MINRKEIKLRGMVLAFKLNNEPLVSLSGFQLVFLRQANTCADCYLVELEGVGILLTAQGFEIKAQKKKKL